MSTLATPPTTTTTWNHRPRSLRCRVQGQAHDDLEREGQFTKVSGSLDSGRIRPDQLAASRRRSTPPRSKRATPSATPT